MENLAHPLSVSDLNHKIRLIVESDLTDVLVTGEISNLTRHSSGHFYFTLKDARSEIPVVMFRGFTRFLRFTIENGMQVTISGNITLYEPRGRLQLVARSMEPAGVGTLYMAFEALKKKLEEIGLFSLDHKRSVKKFPRKIGIITSPTGAAIRDILQVLERRAPYVEIYFRPALVQGAGAASDLVKALGEVENTPDIDTVIIGRGGGSLEDLWAFNEEIVVRAIHTCRIPVISAVGHETDISLTDLVSDLRAPTPSVAAELVATSVEEIKQTFLNYGRQSFQALGAKLQNSWQTVDSLTARIEFLKPHKQILRSRDDLQNLKNRLFKITGYKIKLDRSNLKALQSKLTAMNPNAVLKRGYSIAFTLPDMKVIRGRNDIPNRAIFRVQTGAGAFKAEKIENIGEK